MEVHHHSHNPGKKWSHYFWEFLMLFLAVFCGFLAEYKLEHTIEKSREKQYIKSFAEDLAADTVDLENRIIDCSLTIGRADSLIALLNLPDKDKHSNDIYYFLRIIHRTTPLSVNDRTIVQLRNAGGMRLITNKSVADSMSSYYKAIDYLIFIYEEQIQHKRSLRPLFPKLLDGNDFSKVIDTENRVVRTDQPLKIRDADVETINTFIIILENIKGINRGIRSRLENLKAQAKRIRKFIYQEYHVE